MNVLNPLGFLAEIKCGISLTSVSFIWGVGRLTFVGAGRELDLKGLSFNFFPLGCSILLGDTMGSRGCFACLQGKGRRRTALQAVLDIWRMMRAASVKCALGWTCVLEDSAGRVTAQCQQAAIGIEMYG